MELLMKDDIFVKICQLYQRLQENKFINKYALLLQNRFIKFDYIGGNTAWA